MDLTTFYLDLVKLMFILLLHSSLITDLFSCTSSKNYCKSFPHICYSYSGLFPFLVFLDSSFFSYFLGQDWVLVAGWGLGGEVRTLQQLLTNKPESLEETLIAPKLTKIEFPQFLRKISASSVVVMND